MCVRAVVHACVCAFVQVHTCMLCVCVGNTHLYRAAFLSLPGALAHGLAFDPGWKEQESQGGWMGLGLCAYTKALPLPCFRDFLAS